MKVVVKGQQNELIEFTYPWTTMLAIQVHSLSLVLGLLKLLSKRFATQLTVIVTRTKIIRQ